MSHSLEATCHDVSFSLWMHIVDSSCQAHWGISYYDLPDLIFYRDWYDSGATVGEFLEEVYEAHELHELADFFLSE